MEPKTGLAVSEAPLTALVLEGAPDHIDEASGCFGAAQALTDALARSAVGLSNGMKTSEIGPVAS